MWKLVKVVHLNYLNIVSSNLFQNISSSLVIYKKRHLNMTQNISNMKTGHIYWAKIKFSRCQSKKSNQNWVCSTRYQTWDRRENSHTISDSPGWFQQFHQHWVNPPMTEVYFCHQNIGNFTTLLKPHNIGTHFKGIETSFQVVPLFLKSIHLWVSNITFWNFLKIPGIWKFN
jgi:hypothetical protein